MKRRAKAMPTSAGGKTAATWRKLTPTQRRIIIAGVGVAALIILTAWFFSDSPREGPTPGAKAKTTVPAPGSVFEPSITPVPELPKGDATLEPWIQAIRLEPAQPTRLDTLKANIVVTAAAPEQIRYTYRWKVNDRTIEDAEGNTLPLATFKKRDLVTVTVTPYAGDQAGFPVESRVVAIHSVPPSLNLKALRQARKTGAPIELQLVGVAPDGNQVAFSLEAPLVPGMTIDKQSGKITWVLQPGQKGTIRFGAAVLDEDRTKVVKIFEVSVD